MDWGSLGRELLKMGAHWLTIAAPWWLAMEATIYAFQRGFSPKTWAEYAKPFWNCLLVVAVVWYFRVSDYGVRVESWEPDLFADAPEYVREFDPTPVQWNT
ncbi:MAG: hypothetical protein HY320_14390 [Armatimonadetes bacterium]|nr:hypothetical protein [Armatimonadota bacterium]